MAIPIQLVSETKNFWTFKEVSNEETKPYDISKGQLRNAFLHLILWNKEPFSNTFTSKLYNLMAKADPINFRKLFNGFPVRTTAYCLWFFTPNKNNLQKYVGGNNGTIEL